MEIRFLETAQLELDDAISNYNKISVSLGDKFYLEILNTLKRIKQYPRAWQSFIQNTRRCLVNHFPYGIIYRIDENVILVIAIACTHREPEYWISRIKDD